jgi:FkbM family methyltransferase
MALRSRLRRALRDLGRPAFASPTPEHHRWLRDLIWDGEYDRPGFVPGRGDRVVDVGANVGVFAVRCATRGAQVQAWEPHPRTFTYLERNTARWRRRVVCHQAAVAARAGTARLFVHDLDTRNTLLARNLWTGETRTDAVDVPAVTLEEALGPGCDLLKLDCEGTEFELLDATSGDVLRRARRVVAELHGEPAAMERFDARLREEGFAVARAPGEDPLLALTFAVRA